MKRIDMIMGNSTVYHAVKDSLSNMPDTYRREGFTPYYLQYVNRVWYPV